MRPLVRLQLLVVGLSLLVAVPVASGSQVTASPSPSPVQTSSAVATYARTYYSRSTAAGSASPAASPNVAASPGRPIVSIAPAPAPAPSVELVVSVSDQKLAVVVNGRIFKDYRISTSRYGEGDNWGSWRTPTGILQIAGKIGASAPAGAVFWRRQVTGEVLPANAPGRDPIVSRIIWLRGLEEANRNAYKRCIYIHGTPQEAFLGRKASFGCIRMRSADVIEVFNWVNVGTPVAILEDPLKRAVKEADKSVTLLAQNSPASLRNEPVAKNVPPRTIAARENIAAEAKVAEVSKAAEAAKASDTAKTADVSKATDYRIPSPIIQIGRVGPPDPTVTVGHKNTTAAN
ncbi:MAG: L,D-transpeptidase family protein [Verrucomicrobia bacterium]|nr:L,D-transpeptidase family protein [Verrucomicrobiota bacterium]